MSKVYQAQKTNIVQKIRQDINGPFKKQGICTCGDYTHMNGLDKQGKSTLNQTKKVRRKKS